MLTRNASCSFVAFSSRITVIATVLLATTTLAVTDFAWGDDSLQFRIQPDQIELTNRDSWQTITLQNTDANGTVQSQVPDESVRWSSSDESVFVIDENRIVAKGTGTAKLVAEVAGSKVTSQVTVHQGDRPTRWEFGNHVEAILARSGCNSGACHGALAGKGGFRLSLRGYDAIGDHFNITRQDRSRRIELQDPAKSLFLTKPSGAIPHKGGLRLPPDSHNYSVIAQWIADGAPQSIPDQPKLVAVEVVPGQINLKPGDLQQLIARARYDNGRIEDVTHWAKFSSADEAVATVDEHGRVTVTGPGLGAISVWYASRIVLAEIVVPYPNDVEPNVFQSMPIANAIDEQVRVQLTRLHLPPSPRCSDEEFIRRAFLDTVGLVPTADELSTFLSDPQTDKRDRLVESLLNRTEFVDYWTYRWSDLLMLNGNLLRPDAIKAYYKWIRAHVEKNTPWDQFVSEILLAKGDSVENGATNFYALNQDPEGMTENACQAFMGLSIGCAKCHNHPLEKWTNDQYYAMANMFARVRAKGWGGDPRDGDGIRSVTIAERGDLIQPLTGKPQIPAPLDADPIDPSSTGDRRESMARWMVAPENPYFTRSIVNRVWAAFFGIGIVNPVDDMRSSNPPSNSGLMDVLCNHLVENHYDLKSLMRLILLSETYQRSSQPLPGNFSEKKYFSHYYPKRLMAEVMHDAICQISGVPSKFTEIEFVGADKKPTDFYPEGTRSIQLYDSSVASYFLKTFGRNQRRITCECERSDEPSVVQVLHLSNGDTINDKLGKAGSIVDKVIEKYGDNYGELVTFAYRACINRSPSDTEVQGLVQELTSAPASEKRLVVEDLFWSLLTSREFLFNH